MRGGVEKVGAAHANRCHSVVSVCRSAPTVHSPNCAPRGYAFLAAAFLGAAFLAALGAAFLAALGLAAAFTLVAVFFTCWSRRRGAERDGHVGGARLRAGAARPATRMHQLHPTLRAAADRSTPWGWPWPWPSSRPWAWWPSGETKRGREGDEE